jgi:hypothetical protein
MAIALVAVTFAVVVLASNPKRIARKPDLDEVSKWL